MEQLLSIFRRAKNPSKTNTPGSESTLEEGMAKMLEKVKEGKKKRNQYYGYSILNLDQMIELECSSKFEDDASKLLTKKHLSTSLNSPSVFSAKIN